MLKKLLGAAPALALLVCVFALLPKRDMEVPLTGNSEFSQIDGILIYKAQPFDGVAVELFPNGTTYRRTHYANGLKHGTSEEFATTGARRALWNFVHGKKEGWQQGWYIEGPPRFKLHYKAGLLDGETTEWYMNGKVSRNQVYRMGIEIAQKVLYPTGEVFANYVIRNNRKFGLNTNELCMDSKKDGELK